jgi:hypothetical protein
VGSTIRLIIEVNNEGLTGLGQLRRVLSIAPRYSQSLEVLTVYDLACIFFDNLNTEPALAPAIFL